jgi:hypothetical protein
MSAGLTFHEAPGICDVGDVRLGPIKTFVNWLKLRVESRFAVMMAKDGSWAVRELFLMTNSSSTDYEYVSAARTWAGFIITRLLLCRSEAIIDPILICHSFCVIGAPAVRHAKRIAHDCTTGSNSDQ